MLFFALFGLFSYFSCHFMVIQAIISTKPRNRDLMKTQPYQFTPDLQGSNVRETLMQNTLPAINSSKHKTTLITTITCKQGYFLLILVSSATSNAKRRRDIRESWGVDTFVNPRWRTVFLVAQTSNPRELNSLSRESEIYGDLVRAKYHDNYFNQTLKIQMGFEWAVRYCKFSFLLKINDDTFVNTRALLALLKDPNTPQKKLYMGRVAPRAVPQRSGKFGVSKEEYSEKFYPPFCPGFGIVFSVDVVTLFVDLFDTIPGFKLEDVYLGLLAAKAGVKATHQSGFDVHPKPAVKCTTMNDTLVRRGVEGDCLFQIYRKLINT